jgi:hypothetical protein
MGKLEPQSKAGPKGISVYRISRSEQMFTFKVETTGEVFHFAVDRLNHYLRSTKAEVTQIIIHEALFKHLSERNGAEIEHFNRISEESLATPGIMLAWSDGSHVQADGTHRALRCAMRGDPTFPAYIVQENVWRRFLVTDVPPDLLDWDDFFENGSRNDPLFPDDGSNTRAIAKARARAERKRTTCP